MALYNAYTKTRPTSKEGKELVASAVWPEGTGNDWQRCGGF